MEAQVELEEEPFEVPSEEIDRLLEEIRKPKRVRRKSITTSVLPPHTD